MSFPSPVGGTVLPRDTTPSIIFIVAFALLFPFIYKRIRQRKEKDTTFLGIIIAIIEREIVFVVRRTEANKVAWPISGDGFKYMQISFTLGYISLAQVLPKLLQAAMVNAFVDESNTNLPAAGQHPALKWATIGYTVAYFLAIVPGFLSGLWTIGAIEDEAKGNRVMVLRYVSAAIALVLNLGLLVLMLVAKSKFPRIKREAVWIFISLCSVLSIPPIYRMAVMHSRTQGSSLSLSDTPGALNGTVDKALFYAFHILPEAIAGALFFVPYNPREIFSLYKESSEGKVDGNNGGDRVEGSQSRRNSDSYQLISLHSGRR